MAVNLSPVGGVAAQFFTNNGVPLSGGKLYTYAAGTTTPQATYTTSNGATAWTNPIVLDSAGRVPSGGEIWLTDGLNYKFVLKDSNDVTIATYDNISGINSNFIAFVNQQEIVTATAGQTVFNLGINYQPGTNSLSVFVDGVNQYGSGAQYAYVETNSNTVTFNSGLHVGAEVKFTTSQQQGAGIVDAEQVSYQPPFTGSVATNVEAKLAQTVSVKDFGAVGDGVTDDTTAIQAALTYAGTVECGVYVPGTSTYYLIADSLTVPDNVTVFGDGWGSCIRQTTLNKDAFVAGNNNVFENLRVKIADGDNSAFVNCIYAVNVNNLTVETCFLESSNLGGCGIHIRGVQNSQIRGNRIYNGQWNPQSAGPSASASDILLYSSSASERHIIEGNHCLSNNSQGIFVDALGYDGDIIVANNICVTLDPATCTETGTWSLVASGGARRHGIMVGYNTTSVSGVRCVVDGNICRNTLWTGIYKQGVSSGAVIISNNLCDLNGYSAGATLAGGIFLTQAGGELVIGNTITNYQNTAAAGDTGAITVTAAASVITPSEVRSNKIVNSAGWGIVLKNYAAYVTVDGNTMTGCADADIYVAPVAGIAGVSGHRITNNVITKTTATLKPGIRIGMQASTLYILVKNNVIRGDDNTTSNVFNAGIYRSGADAYVQIVGNVISNFYYGVYGAAYWTGGRMADVQFEQNIIRDCNSGFALGATSGVQTVPLTDNRFINVTTPSAAALGGAVAGRIVSRQGTNFVWQTTAAPTTGTWAVGDRSVNSAPAVGSPKAWTCTVAGAPGTWVSEGNL